MNKIKIIRLSFLMLSTLIFTQCNKLEEKVYSSNTEDVFFQSPNDVKTALAGMYRSMQACCGGYGQAGTMILNATSDEGNGAGAWGDFHRLTFTSSSTGEIGDWWSQTL